MLLLFAFSENILRLQEKTAENGQNGQKKGPAVSQVLEIQNGGGGWIRTIEVMDGRFTVYCI